MYFKNIKSLNKINVFSLNSIYLKMNENGRVTFDIKMAQMIKMNISCKLIHCILEENLEEKAYNFSIKVKVKYEQK